MATNSKVDESKPLTRTHRDTSLIDGVSVESKAVSTDGRNVEAVPPEEYRTKLVVKQDSRRRDSE